MPFAVAIVTIDFASMYIVQLSVGFAMAAGFVDSLCLALWARIACKNCRALGAAQMRFSPLIAFLSVILPVVNIFTGRHIFQELWQRGYGATITRPSRLIEVAFRLIVYGVLVVWIAKPIVEIARYPGAASLLATLGYLASLVGLVMRVVAVFEISQRQAEAFRRLSVIYGIDKG